MCVSQFRKCAIIAIASWCPVNSRVQLHIDWDAVGLDPQNAKAFAPNISFVQPASIHNLKLVNGTVGPLAVAANGGLVLVVEPLS